MHQAPTSNSAEFGFLLAVTVITAIFNLNWRHYIRYFLGRTPEFGSIRVRIFRWAFLAAFLGSLGQFGLAAFSGPHTGQELLGTLVVAAGALLAFALIDGLFRLLWRRL
jgi:hypothetical protein